MRRGKLYRTANFAIARGLICRSLLESGLNHGCHCPCQLHRTRQK
jgi:hypothetical protein